MSRDFKLYLKDISEAAVFIETHTRELTSDQLAADEVLLRAVLHSLTIIGEAAKHIPDDIRQYAPDIPWQAIAGARDIIVHGYFAVNMLIIWDIVEKEIPELRQHIEKLLQDLP